MVMIIHGFPNDIAALRFEWAWQHPDVSRRLRHLPKKKPRQKSFDFHLMVLSEMLRVGAWSRLPLTIRWLATGFDKNFPVDCIPPLHMPVVFGKVISKKLANSNKAVVRSEDTPVYGIMPICCLCKKCIEPDEILSCLSPTCSAASHLICLAKFFSKDTEMILPIEGTCPTCEINLLWGDLIRKKKGCYQDLTAVHDSSSDSDIDFDD